MTTYPHRQRIWQGPVFSGHEHLGSVSSMGASGWFFRCDQEKGCVPSRTGLADLLFSPYLGGSLGQLGVFPREGEAVGEMLRRVLPSLKTLANKGLVQALEQALKDLYGQSLWELTSEEAEKLEEQIQRRYQEYYGWYRQVMKRTCCLKVVRTVHPSYFVTRGICASEEEDMVLPLLRVDTLLGYPEQGKVNLSYFSPVSGIYPDSLENLERSVEILFSQLVDSYKIVGLKQFQAYLRTLSSPPVSPKRAEEAFLYRKDPEQMRVLQDYLFHLILQQANQRNLVFQIHTGMTTLQNSSPALLEPLISQYSHVRFVLLHCYPFVEQAAYLASVYPNVMLDTSWLALQGEWVLEKALEQYLTMVPFKRICLSQDATSLEEFYGADRITRRVLERVLDRMVEQKICTPLLALEMADRLLFSNSAELYGFQ